MRLIFMISSFMLAGILLLISLGLTQTCGQKNLASEDQQQTDIFGQAIAISTDNPCHNFSRFMLYGGMITIIIGLILLITPDLPED
jgi:hypothetical protein